MTEEAIRPYTAHPMTAASIGNSIGLSLTEEPLLSATRDDVIEAGCVYSMRVGVSDGIDHHAIVSAMIHVEQNDIEVYGPSQITQSWSCHPERSEGSDFEIESLPQSLKH